ncbi:urease-associated protein [Haloferula helveola]|uniref:Urease-associated protein n=1 Tax=Haloferula helveola TaxID=490095 RepID=A0ABM7RFA7_9BACT|nr:urease-associated protein [Haloferula helveola]
MKSGWVRYWLPACPLFFASCALKFPQDEVEVRRVEVTRAATPEPATVPVVLFSDELHTGLILDLQWLQRHGYKVPRESVVRQWAAFSWGDQTAYVQERWLSPGQVIHALFMPSPSVMEIITFDWNIPEVCHHQRLYQTYVPDSAGVGLAAFLNSCAVRDGEGIPNTIAPSSWGSGRLIESPHSYYFPRICNVWTVEALNSTGFEMAGVTGLSADGVIRQATKPKNGFAKIWDPAWQTAEGGDEPGE